MTSTTQTRRLPAQRSGAKGFLARLFAAEALWRQRQHLAKLDDAALRDIGVSRAQAEAEATRGVWAAPRHWMR